jgi:hypothetical protein
MTRFALALIVRLLGRGGWGRAMLAEFDAIEDPRERRRFALGCAGVALTRPGLWLRTVAIVLVGALLFTRPGGHSHVVAVLVLAVCLVALTRVQAPAITAAGALLWWAALLGSETVRAHPQWALIVIAACTVVAAPRGGAVAALGTALATCLAIFVVAVGTYAALPRLAPDIAPANAVDPQLENQIESTDPYVGELLLAALLGVGLIATVRTRC